jgi:D-xylose transport system substrate-binding protein
VTKAKAQKVPVVNYDRLVTDADVDAYVSYDNEHVGVLQAEALIGALKKAGKPKGPIVQINGAPTDNNAKLFKKGASGGFTKAGVKVAKEYDTPDWSADKAQDEMQQANTALGNNGFAGVYAANDGTSGGAIAAMKSAGIDPKSRPTTGQDAELAGIQRILAGQQFMTIYKASKPEAEITAQIAVDLAQGKKLDTSVVKDSVNNGKKDVPSVIFQPVAVTKDNVKDTIVKDGYWPTSDICSGSYASACKAAGIS